MQECAEPPLTRDDVINTARRYARLEARVGVALRILARSGRGSLVDYPTPLEMSLVDFDVSDQGVTINWNSHYYDGDVYETDSSFIPMDIFVDVAALEEWSRIHTAEARKAAADERKRQEEQQAASQLARNRAELARLKALLGE